jgi:hypothetical protein
MEWGPATSIIFLLGVNSLSALIFVGRRISFSRLIIAMAITPLIHYACIFALTAFGWGWADIQSRPLLYLRMGLGISIGVCAALFVFIVSMQWNTVLATTMIVLNAIIFAPDPNQHIVTQLAFSGFVLVLSSHYWYRKLLLSHSGYPGPIK